MRGILIQSTASLGIFGPVTIGQVFPKIAGENLNGAQGVIPKIDIRIFR